MLSGKKDIYLNVIFPVVTGCFIYLFSETRTFPAVIRNYLADGLWAYAFISCILIIWDRKVKTVWIAITFLVPAVFEFFQYKHLLPGTGDVLDLCIYYAFYFLALFINKFRYQIVSYDKN